MTDPIEVATVHDIKIIYDAEKKQFMARVGGRDFRKSSQGAIEKIISRFVKGDERVKAVILEYGWRQVQVIPIEVVGMRGSRVQYKHNGYMEGEDADKVFVHDDALLDEARQLRDEHDKWLSKWEKLVKKAKKVDPANLK